MQKKKSKQDGCLLFKDQQNGSVYYVLAPQVYLRAPVSVTWALLALRLLVIVWARRIESGQDAGHTSRKQSLKKN